MWNEFIQTKTTYQSDQHKVKHCIEWKKDRTVRLPLLVLFVKNPFVRDGQNIPGTSSFRRDISQLFWHWWSVWGFHIILWSINILGPHSDIFSYASSLERNTLSKYKYTPHNFLNHRSIFLWREAPWPETSSIQWFSIYIVTITINIAIPRSI